MPDRKEELDHFFLSFRTFLHHSFWFMISESLSAGEDSYLEEREGGKEPFTTLCRSAIASNQISTPPEIRYWPASLAYFFLFRLHPCQTAETNVSRAIYSALTAMCHRSSHSQVTTSLGIKADIFPFFGIHLTVNLLSIWWGSLKHCKQLVRRM